MKHLCSAHSIALLYRQGHDEQTSTKTELNRMQHILWHMKLSKANTIHLCWQLQHLRHIESEYKFICVCVCVCVLLHLFYISIGRRFKSTMHSHTIPFMLCIQIILLTRFMCACLCVCGCVYQKGENIDSLRHYKCSSFVQRKQEHTASIYRVIEHKGKLR